MVSFLVRPRCSDRSHVHAVSATGIVDRLVCVPRSLVAPLGDGSGSVRLRVIVLSVSSFPLRRVRRRVRRHVSRWTFDGRVARVGHVGRALEEHRGRATSPRESRRIAWRITWRITWHVVRSVEPIRLDKRELASVPFPPLAPYYLCKNVRFFGHDRKACRPLSMTDHDVRSVPTEGVLRRPLLLPPNGLPDRAVSAASCTVHGLLKRSFRRSSCFRSRLH